MVTDIACVVLFMFIGVLVAIIRKDCSLKTKVIKATLLFLGCITVVFLLRVLPIEKWFFSYDSPEELARSANYGDVEQVIEGHDSCLLIVRQLDGSMATYYLKKEDGKYEFGNGSALNLKHVQRISDDLQLSVYQFEKTNDYYATLSDRSNKERTVFDQKGVEFYKKQDPKKTVCVYYAYINSFDMNYSITIDGQEYNMEKQY